MEQVVCKGQLCFSTGPETRQSIPDGFLVCTDGICRGAFSTLPEAYRDLPLLDFGNRLILPGLVDLHLHAPQFAYRGLGMDLELLDWLNTNTFPEESKNTGSFHTPRNTANSSERCSQHCRAVMFATAHTPATEYHGLCWRKAAWRLRGPGQYGSKLPAENLREPSPAAIAETRAGLAGRPLPPHASLRPSCSAFFRPGENTGLEPTCRCKISNWRNCPGESSSARLHRASRISMSASVSWTPVASWHCVEPEELSILRSSGAASSESNMNLIGARSTCRQTSGRRAASRPGLGPGRRQRLSLLFRAMAPRRVTRHFTWLPWATPEAP